MLAATTRCDAASGSSAAVRKIGRVCFISRVVQHDYRHDDIEFQWAACFSLCRCGASAPLKAKGRRAHARVL